MSGTPIKKKSPLRVILEGDFNREHQKTNILKPVHHIVLGKYIIVDQYAEYCFTIIFRVYTSAFLVNDLQDPAERDFVVSLLRLHDFTYGLRFPPCGISSLRSSTSVFGL